MDLRQRLARSSIRGYSLALLAACGWATGGLVGKWALTAGQVAPSLLAGARACVAALVLGVWLFVFRRGDLMRRNTLRQWVFAVLFGTLAVTGVQFTYFKTISLTNVATAILLEYLAPIFTLTASVVLFKHVLRWQMVIAVGMAILGCAIAVEAFKPGGMAVSTAGLLWGLAAALFFALYSMMGVKGNQLFDSWVLLFYGLLFAALLWTVVLGPARIMDALRDPSFALAVVIIAIVSTILSYGAFLVALKTISPTSASLAAMLEPIAAGIGAAALFGERLTLSLVVGGALILGSIAFIQTAQVDQGLGERFRDTTGSHR